MGPNRRGFLTTRLEGSACREWRQRCGDCTQSNILGADYSLLIQRMEITQGRYLVALILADVREN